MKISEGKRKGLEALSNQEGAIAAVAMDQRGSLTSAIAKSRGVAKDAVKPEDLAEFKSVVTKVLTPHASVILLDPEYSLNALKHVAKGTGVLLAYEKSGYDNSQPGRRPDLLPNWSARRLVEAGATAVKVLLYYTPLDLQEINDEKHAFVERVGAECATLDVPFFLELVGYKEGRTQRDRNMPPGSRRLSHGPSRSSARTATASTC